MGLPRKLAKDAIIKNPYATDNEIAKKLHVSLRTVTYARADLVKEGVIPSNRRFTESPEVDIAAIMPQIAAETTPEAQDSPLTEENEKQLLDGRTLRELSNDEAVDDLENDEDTRRRLLKIIKNIAFSPKTHPDTRITAIQAWTKLRDIAKTKELGPGPPLSEDDVLTRLIRIYKGVGPRLVIRAVELAFSTQKDVPDAKSQQDSPVIGTQETTSTS